MNTSIQSSIVIGGLQLQLGQDKEKNWEWNILFDSPNIEGELRLLFSYFFVEHIIS
jgi:hypothetical protein